MPDPAARYAAVLGPGAESTRGGGGRRRDRLCCRSALDPVLLRRRPRPPVPALGVDPSNVGLLGRRRLRRCTRPILADLVRRGARGRGRCTPGPGLTPPRPSGRCNDRPRRARHRVHTWRAVESPFRQVGRRVLDGERAAGARLLEARRRLRPRRSARALWRSRAGCFRPRGRAPSTLGFQLVEEARYELQMRASGETAQAEARRVGQLLGARPLPGQLGIRLPGARQDVRRGAGVTSGADRAYTTSIELAAAPARLPLASWPRPIAGTGSSCAAPAWPRGGDGRAGGRCLTSSLARQAGRW